MLIVLLLIGTLLPLSVLDLVPNAKTSWAGPGSWSYVVVSATNYGAGCHRRGLFGYAIACCPLGYQNVSYSHSIGGSNTIAWTNDNRELLCGPNPPWVPYPNNVGWGASYGHGPAACLVSIGYAPNMKILCAK
jgi:hypothetical protein